jgi:rod shape-determining protein MreB
VIRRTRAGAQLAVDLGTAETRLVARGKGIIARVPTAVATAASKEGRQVVAVGEAAWKMIGRTPAGTEVVRPVRGGVVADFAATEQLLADLLARAGAGPLRRARLLVTIPSGTTEVERRAVQDATRAAGAGQVWLVASPMAAAIGAELPVTEPVGSLIVDVGAGRTHVAVAALGGLVVRRSLQLAGDDIDQAVHVWLRRHAGLVVGDRTAETLKIRVGTVTPEVHGDLRLRVRGRDLATARPTERDVTAGEVAEAIDEVVGRIRGAVREALREIPPELSADIVARGALLCGGTSQLRGLDARLREDSGLAVLPAERPLDCVALGAARLLDDPVLLERVASAE